MRGLSTWTAMFIHATHRHRQSIPEDGADNVMIVSSKMGYHATRANPSRQSDIYNRSLYPSLLLQGRGISKSSIDSLQPLPERPEEPDSLSYYGKLPATKGDSLDDYALNGAGIDSPLPLESERSCLRDEDLDSSRNQSELSDSNTWSVCTGNLTGRSSVNSWGNDDEFDRQASATVRRMFDEIDELLFEENNSQGSDPLSLECKEWSNNFPHMRIVGSQLLSLDESGTQFIVSNDADRFSLHNRPDTAITAISLDDVKTETLNTNLNGLSISGLKVSPLQPPWHHESFTNNDGHGSNPYSHLEEEIYATDGDSEEYFAFDAEYVEPWDMAKDERKNKRNRQCGYPPVTPNASAADSLTSETFDHLWEEVVQCLRTLLILFIDRSSRDYGKTLLPAHTRQIDNSSVRTFSRDSSFRTGTLSSQYGFKSLYGAPSQSSDVMGLNELMLIRSLSLRQRDSSTASMMQRDEDGTHPVSRDQLRPVSSNLHSSKGFQGSINMHHSDHQFYGKASAVKAYKRSGKLQPLQPMDRIKTPGSMDNDVVGEMVIGTRLHTAGDHRLSINNLPTFSPQFWGGKSGTLPPIERLDTTETLCNLVKDRTRSPKQRLTPFSKRASSAATNETRRTVHRDKIIVLPDSRPNTTHTFRSESPMSDSSKRPQYHEKASSVSSVSSRLANVSDQNEHAIGVLHGVSLPIGAHNQSSKTVSFEDDVDGLSDLAMWGNGPPLLNQQQQKKRRANVR